jgi:signal transduction histidine kinase
MPRRRPLLYGSGVDEPRVGQAAAGPRPGGPGWSGAGWHGRRGPRRPAFALPVALAAVQVFGTRAAAHGRLDALAYALLLAGPVALLVRRPARPLATAVALAAATAYFTLGYPGGPAFVAALVAAAGAVRAGYRVSTWVMAGTGYLVWAFAGALATWLGGARSPGLAGHPLALPSPVQVVMVGAWLLLALAVFEAWRVRLQHFAEVARARAEEQRARAERERAQAEQQRRLASEERLRIARELHDALGHHLSLINVQAGVGLHLMDERPEQARDALTAIKQASAQALREVRAVLAALQSAEDAAPRTPAPDLSGAAGGLSGLSALLADVRAAGLPVDLEVDGAPRPLPAEVDRAGYRIVQEALTNVRRHAGAVAHATVTVRYGDGLELSIVDDGTGPSGVDGTGTGVAGMRERAAALGGELRARPREAGGFEVYARLPAAGEEGT